MQDWLNCKRCGDRYKSFLTSCPRCGYANHSSHKSTSNKRIGVVVGGVGTIAVVGFLLVVLYNPFLDSGKSEATDQKEPVSAATGNDPGSEASSTAPDSVTPASSSQNPVSLDGKDTTLHSLREYTLSIINKDRQEHGLEPVRLSDNMAAQAHAEDLHKMLSDSSHWTSDGMKPYMRYTVYDGTGYVSQNVHSGLVYHESDILQCRVGLAICTKIDIYKTLEESEYSMMYDDAHADWGHRDNILDKHHTHVSLGIVYDDYYFAYVQNFENNYIRLDQPITQENGFVWMRGEIDRDYTLSSITVHYDESPTLEVYNRDKDLNSYSMGDVVAGVTQPGWHYDEIATINADTWSMHDNRFEVAFDISEVTTEVGVYTIMVFLEYENESFPALTYSIFV